MTKHKIILRLAFIIISGFTVYSFISCSGNQSKGSDVDQVAQPTGQKYDGVIIEVNISNKNWLSISLASDGTINRKGNSNYDPKDKNFFMGLTNTKVFDSLMNEMPKDLLQYCNSQSPACDTLKQTCKAKIAFGNNTSPCEIEYCVYGTVDNLPKPIKEFINRAIEATEPWYKEQQKLLNNK